MKFKEEFEAEKVRLNVEPADSKPDRIELAVAPNRSGVASCRASSDIPVAQSLGGASVVPPSEKGVAAKPEVARRTKTMRLLLFGLFALLLFSLGYIVITTALMQWKCAMTKHHAAAGVSDK